MFQIICVRCPTYPSPHPPAYTDTLLAERAFLAHSTRQKEVGRKSSPAPTYSLTSGHTPFPGVLRVERKVRSGGKQRCGHHTPTRMEGPGSCPRSECDRDSERQSGQEREVKQSPRHWVLAFPKCIFSPGTVSTGAWPLTPAQLVVIFLGVQLLDVLEVLLHAGSRAELHLGLSQGCS